MKKNIHLYSFIFTLILLQSSCVDRDFDEPPLNGEDPNIDASEIISIDDLKDLYVPGDFVKIGLEKYLKVIVSADDRSGNFFRSLIIQDETGGIAILLDDVELWNKYFIGKRLFINLSQLWISDFNGLPQIGFTPFDDDGQMTLGRIPAVLIEEIVMGGTFNNTIEPQVLTISQLSNVALNTLVKIEDLQFIQSSLNTTLADADNLISVNHVVEDCDGNRVIFRTSGFADFAPQAVPEGNGDITAIYGVFGADKQLIIRELSDIDLSDPRCDPNAIVVDENDVISISEMMQNYMPGVEVPLQSDKFLKGSVVSDDQAGNFFKSLVIQDETGGIAVLADKFDLFETYPIGQIVYIKLKDLCISDFNGLPQLCYPSSGANVKRIPESEVETTIILSNETQNITPAIKSIDNLSLSDLNTYVQFDAVQFAAGSVSMTYADAVNQFSVNHIIEDCDENTITLRTSGFADFADNITPSGNGTIVGILQIFSGTWQIYIRDLQDVNFQAVRCGGMGTSGPFFEEFEGLADFDPVFIPGWTNVALKGDRIWVKRSFDGNGFAETEAFQDSNPETDDWLITPQINTTETPSLSFKSAMAFYAHDGLSVSVSSNFSGDVANATWQLLNVPLATEADQDFTWIDSGVIDLSQYGESVHVAFRYVGTTAANTTKVRIDDVLVE